MTPDADTAYRFLTEKPAQYGQMLGYTNLRDDLHGRWIHDMIVGHDDMTLQAHRGSYKTTCVCIALAAVIILRGDINSIFLRKTDTDIQEVIKNVTRILRHPVTQELYRALTGKQLAIIKATSSEITASSYTAPNGAVQLLGIGIGGSLTGKHAWRVWTDDIVNLKDRVSPAEREATKAIYQELQNVKNPGGRIINTGTPWHKDDAFALMPPAMRFDCYETRMLDAQQIEALKQSMAPSLFAANYELRHIASEGALFATQPVYATEEEAREILGDDAVPVDLLRDGIAHIDAAYGGEDYTAFTCGRRRGDTLYLYGRIWQKHVDTVLDAVIADAQRVMCAPVLCEDNGDKGFLVKEIREKDYSARKYHEKENKYIKISTYLRKWWPNIRWIPGTDREYLTQIMDYTEDAAHDDAPDSASVVARYYDRRGDDTETLPVFF